MCSTGIIKRLLPFAITLIIGLFIASFFVDLTPRPFGFRGGRAYRYREMQRMYMDEHDRAERLQRELDLIKQSPMTLQHLEPWNDPDHAVPPVAPRSR